MVGGSIAARVRRELVLYRRVAAHPRTPAVSRWLLFVAVAYAASPIDIIPDFIPVLGHLDDALIVPCLAIVALILIPSDVMAECREAVGSGSPMQVATEPTDPDRRGIANVQKH